MHRGEVSIEEATEFLIEHTGFERPNALAEARRYTYTPTYNLSYLLGKVLLLRLREDEGRRLGSAFSLARLPRHAAPRRLAADQLPPPGAARRGPDRPPGRVGLVQVIPAIDVERGRSRIVFWPGVSTGIGAPTDRPERIAEHFVSVGAPLDPHRRLRRRAARRAGEHRRDRRHRLARRDAAPARRRPRFARGDPGGVRRRRDPRRREPRPRRRSGTPAGVRRDRRRLARDRARRASRSARSVPVAPSVAALAPRPRFRARRARHPAVRAGPRDRRGRDRPARGARADRPMSTCSSRAA